MKGRGTGGSSGEGRIFVEEKGLCRRNSYGGEGRVRMT